MSEPDEVPWRTGQEPDGATPLSEDDKDGLRLSWVATRGDLNAAEAANIARALTMPRLHRYTTAGLLDDHVLRQLHATMFDEVWKWAGKYRATEKNIGCDPDHIAIRVRDLCDDAKYWFQETMPADEAGCRFHHVLVTIHPFANGNGRHARAITDLVMRSVDAPPFIWGRINLVDGSATRKAYIEALQAADRGTMNRLGDSHGHDNNGSDRRRGRPPAAQLVGGDGASWAMWRVTWSTRCTISTWSVAGRP